MGIHRWFRSYWWGLLALGLMLSLPLQAWWMNRHEYCVRTIPGTCYVQHVPLHSGPYPCQVCVERRWSWDRPPDAPETGDPIPEVCGPRAEKRE